jgi:hypothetical protein
MPSDTATDPRSVVLTQHSLAAIADCAGFGSDWSASILHPGSVPFDRVVERIGPANQCHHQPRERHPMPGRFDPQNATTHCLQMAGDWSR